MNNIFTKLKTSATLWTVIAGIAVGVAELLGADGGRIGTVSGAVCVIVPATAYIICKFRLRIRTADANADGRISADELVSAVLAAVRDSEDKAAEIRKAVTEAAEASHENA